MNLATKYNIDLSWADLCQERANVVGEKCGLVGVVGTSNFKPEDLENLAIILSLGVAHRGQDGGGVAYYNSSSGEWDAVYVEKPTSHEFAHGLPCDKRSTTLVTHCRYKTSGDFLPSNSQPFILETSKGKFSLAHNGNLVNHLAIQKYLEEQGVIVQGNSDSVILSAFLKYAIDNAPKDKSIELIVGDVLSQLKGSFALIIGTPEGLIGATNGNRPLEFGITESGAVVFCSENNNFDQLKIQNPRPVRPAEMIYAKNTGEIEHFSFTPQGRAINSTCLFELVYFRHPASTYNGRSIGEVRNQIGRKMGEGLADFLASEIDLVIPILDSGADYAEGFSAGLNEHSNYFVEYKSAIKRDKLIGRTYISTDPAEKALAKYHIIPEAVKGNRVAVVDDSLVSATTMKIIVKKLYEAGAVSVDIIIPCPPIVNECFYGIVMEKEKLFMPKFIDSIRRWDNGILSSDPGAKALGASGLYFASFELVQDILGPGCSACMLPAQGKETDYPLGTPLTDDRFEGLEPLRMAN